MNGSCINCSIAIDPATCPYIKGEPYCFNCYCNNISYIGMASSTSFYPTVYSGVYSGTAYQGSGGGGGGGGMYPPPSIQMDMKMAKYLKEQGILDGVKIEPELEKELEEKIIESTKTMSKKRKIDFD